MKNTNTRTLGERVFAIVLSGIMLFVVGGKKIDGTLKLVRKEPTRQMTMLNAEQLSQLKGASPLKPINYPEKENTNPNPDMVAILPKQEELLQVKKAKSKKKVYPGVKQFA